MEDSLLARMQSSSHLSGSSAVYVESMYEQYLDDPNSVPEEWRSYFGTLTINPDVGADVAHSTIIGHFERLGRNKFKARPERESPQFIAEHERKQIRVLELINAYRTRGHLRAKLDPLDSWHQKQVDDLLLESHGLTEADFDTEFSTGTTTFLSSNMASLRDIITALERTYCGSIGAEYTYLSDEQEELWIKQRLETVQSNPIFEEKHKRTIFERLAAAEGLEHYLHNRFPGTKRFGLEGGESLIPMLHELLQRFGIWGVIEVVIGMAHRGRLNVLVNILGKKTSDLFEEFAVAKISVDDDYTGDVKYHQGFSSNVTTSGGEMHVALAFNPSHLEIVSPVVEGSVRARQDRRSDPDGVLVAPVLIHGDAAFAGQGVVMETFQMSQTRGFSTGGTVHIIINNQIGFTTSNLDDARSTEYCSEIAKMVNAPIFHVNADDPEAVVFVTQIAADYRMAYAKDVVIDLVCYRRRGHNEAEEPMKTQPLMYARIAKHPTTKTLYATRLLKEGVLQPGEADEMAVDLRSRLDEGESIALSIIQDPNPELFVDWSPYLGHEWTDSADTTFDRLRMLELSRQLSLTPTGFVVHKQIQKILEDRLKMAAGAASINWGFAETMAYASLLDQGYKVRLTGQDVGVGTFSHRHASMYCQKTGEQFIPLETLGEGKVFSIYDSLLSEEAVLAFEYGYATTTPDSLVIWEAQFGDFANGAQVVIDQFLSSGEAKWSRLCGLVMLLPHGYEGQGAEHSSARLERFLQLCAEKNIQVCCPTTPAQIFHLLRRQAIRMMRRPLIVMSPKSLLRHKLAISMLEELTEGKFECVIPEPAALQAEEVNRLVFCSGKVYFELYETRGEQELKNVAIVRLEQLYPFPKQELREAMSSYQNLEKIVWCQEEPMNQGAWYSSKHHLNDAIEEMYPNLELTYAGRRSFAAPAAGSQARHKVRQAALVQDALTG